MNDAPRTASRPGTLRERVSYRFDSAMARGPMSVVAYLGLLTAGVVVIGTLLTVVTNVSFGGSSHGGFGEDAWQVLVRTLDKGAIKSDTDWGSRALSLGVVLLGIFLAGALIGLISGAVSERIADLRNGVSRVLEQDHTVILGWSEEVPRIVAELAEANQTRRRAAVVILANESKSSMEGALRARLTSTRNTRVVCRNGEPSSSTNLERCALSHARSVIAVRGDEGDAGVVKAILAVKTVVPDLDRFPLVAELADQGTAEVIRSVTNDRVVTVSSDAVVAEVTAQGCLQPGLSSIFSDLLDFAGDELYFSSVPQLIGRTYRDASLSFATCSVVGLRHANGATSLNPESTTVIAAGDEVILVATDDRSIQFSETHDYPSLFASGATGSLALGLLPLRVLVVGWSKFGERVLRELNEFLPGGSRVTVMVDPTFVDPDAIKAGYLHNATVQVTCGAGRPIDFGAFAADHGVPDRTIVLGYRDALSANDADARTLVSLLALRAQWPSSDDGVRVVAEVLDQRNVALAAPVAIDDFIVSSALTSRMLAQLSERPALDAVFADLFAAGGAEAQMRPAEAFATSEPIPFGAVVAAGLEMGVSVIGFRLGRTGAVRLNPPKSELIAFTGDDHVAVIATARPEGAQGRV